MSTIPEDLYQDPEVRALAKEQLELQNAKARIELDSLRRSEEKILASRERAGEFNFIGNVSELSVHTLIEDLQNFSVRNPGADIKLLINSGGGSVIDGLALVDYIKILQKRGHRVTTFGIGMVASMAGAILMAGDERVLTPRAYLGMHEVSSYMGGRHNVTEQEDITKFAKELQEQIIELLCARSKLTKQRLQTMWKRRDVYMSAQKALEMGLIDRIEEVE